MLQENISIDNWYEEVKYIYRLKQKTRQIVSLMCSRFYKIQQPVTDKDFTEWLELYNEKPQTYYYLLDDLTNIVNTDIPINTIDVVPVM